MILGSSIFSESIYCTIIFYKVCNMSAIHYLCLITSFVIVLIHRVNCSRVIVTIDLTQYTNSQDKLQNGEKCEMWHTIDKCDPKFVINLMSSGYGASIIYAKTQRFGNKKYINYVYHGSKVISLKIPSTMYLAIKIVDVDSSYGGEELIGFEKDSFYISEKIDIEKTYHMGYAKLKAKLSITCQPHWFGKQCDTLCVPQLNNLNNYECNAISGEKTCLLNCKNGGSCLWRISHYICNCPSRYYGSKCEYKLTTTTTTTTPVPTTTTTTPVPTTTTTTTTLVPTTTTFLPKTTTTTPLPTTAFQPSSSVSKTTVTELNIISTPTTHNINGNYDKSTAKQTVTSPEIDIGDHFPIPLALHNFTNNNYEDDIPTSFNEMKLGPQSRASNYAWDHSKRHYYWLTIVAVGFVLVFINILIGIVIVRRISKRKVKIRQYQKVLYKSPQYGGQQEVNPYSMNNDTYAVADFLNAYGQQDIYEEIPE